MNSSVRSQTQKARAHLDEAASDLMNGGKKFANELYAEGVHKVHEAEQNVKEYSDELLLKVKENPVTSLLIAAGVGFLISTLLKK
jgi:ElaB/YqjD/DUF883 family membrane-anchored ribosome-binding protein